jgi:hypothetical protein
MGVSGVCKRNRHTAEKLKRRVVSSRSTGSQFLARILHCGIGRSGSRRSFNRAKTALRSHGEYLACQREDRTRNVSCTHLNDAALVVGIKLDPLEAHMNDPRNTTGYFRWIKSMGFNGGDAGLSRDRADIKKLTRCEIRGKR